MGDGLLPVLGPVPERILCQTGQAGCGACCGMYNFTDRSPRSHHRRLRRRTERVLACFGDDGRPDEEQLRIARDELLEEERPQVLSGAIKVCPYAGYLEGVPSDPGQGRVGCLLHPRRHPDGADLRHLAVYSREICDGHFCAPHDWLRDIEMDLAQTATGVLYGQVVTDAGLVKAVRTLLEEGLGRALRKGDIERARPALARLWRRLLEDWPWRDPDPRRFGGIYVTDDDATERTLPRTGAALPGGLPRPLEVVLDAAQTCAGTGREGPSPDDILAAAEEARHLIATVLEALRAHEDAETDRP